MINEDTTKIQQRIKENVTNGLGYSGKNNSFYGNGFTHDRTLVYSRDNTTTGVLGYHLALMDAKLGDNEAKEFTEGVERVIIDKGIEIVDRERKQEYETSKNDPDQITLSYIPTKKIPMKKSNPDVENIPPRIRSLESDLFYKNTKEGKKIRDNQRK